MMWLLILSLNGEPPIEVSFPQFNIEDAIRQAKTIYGPDVNILGQEYIGDK
jgi:hypothetical protein